MSNYLTFNQAVNLFVHTQEIFSLNIFWTIYTNYLPTSHKTHCVSSAGANWLMLYSEIIAVYS
jgi:hypothetical protein